jgi:hypothetical protein
MATAVSRLYAPSSGVKRGRETIDLRPEDFFDRIINLRVFVLNDEGGLEQFTIRSDYEAVYDKNGGLHYTECRQKPAIKVAYRQVSNAAIDIQIDVTNLFIDGMDLTKFNRKRSFTSERGNRQEAAEDADPSNPIGAVYVQMGYRAQFPDWTRGEWAKKPLADFNALKTDKIDGLFLTCQLLAIYQTKSPPDKVTHFRCAVGSAETGLLWVYREEDLHLDPSQMSKAQRFKTPPGNDMWAMFYGMVTRRFVRSDVPHKVETKYADAKKTVKEQKVIIYDDTGKVKETLKLAGGAMNEEDADKYGVKVSMSYILWKTPDAELPDWNAPPAREAGVKPVLQPLHISLQNKLMAQLAEFQKERDYIRYLALSDGSFFAYHAGETVTQLFVDPYVNEKQKEGILKLPAVYDMQLSGVQTIRCPFCCVINPGTTVAFQSTFALGDMVSYFYKPEPGHDCFLVLYADIDFATVENTNVMKLTVEMVNNVTTMPDGSLKAEELPVTEEHTERLKIWRKRELEVVARYTGKDTTTNSSWHDIAARLKNATRYDGIDASGRWGKGRPTTEDAMNALADWNGHLFTGDRINFAVSPESGTDGVAGMDVPVLYHKSFNPINPGESDMVNVRLPFLPEYFADEEIAPPYDPSGRRPGT